MRRALLATAIALFVLAPAAAAPAATRYLIRGAGFGHGIGMSQYGALGFAEHGWGYRSILAHYYPHTSFADAGDRQVRILLQQGRRIVVDAVVRDPKTGQATPMTYVATPRAFGFELRDGHNHLLGDYQAPVGITSVTGSQTLRGVALQGLANGAYRGTIEISALPTGDLLAINLLSLEDYVAGVVPAEVVASWPAEALKAQAVAARTYALATKAGGALFDQYPDTRSQEYKGLSGEAAASTAAVRATSGQTLVYGGAFATTFFFSTSGGHTENVENVFYGATPEPYLVGVPDPYEGSAPLHRWRFSLSQHQLQAKLGGLCKGTFRALRNIRHGTSPRVVSATLACSRGTTRTTGVALRQALGLYDTWFTLTRISTSPARPARAAGLLERLLAPSRAIAGSIDPAPADGVVEVERRQGSGFVAWGYATTSPQGGYSFATREPGVYRVRSGDLVGPAVTVR